MEVRSVISNSYSPNNISPNLEKDFFETKSENLDIKPIPTESKVKEQSKDVDVNISNEKLEEVIKSMNQFLMPTNSSIKFKLHDDLKEYYVEIIDETTKEVVREIPSKKMLDMYAAMKDFLGLVVDRKI